MQKIETIAKIKHLLVLAMLIMTMPIMSSEALSHYGDIIAEGKTKIIKKCGFSTVEVVSKDDITAGDGLRHDIMPRKAELSTTTTCNIFTLLNKCGIPTAFEKQISKTTFLAQSCEMFPYEVVIRRAVYGSCLARNPHLSKGHYFPQLIVEFFLKTSDKMYNGISIPTDDPLVKVQNDKLHLYLPNVPLNQQKPFMVLDHFPCDGNDEDTFFEDLAPDARHIFLILEKAFQLVGGRLVDLKLEFGCTKTGEDVLADVIDADSFRLFDSAGNHLDKQPYRDGADLVTMEKLYTQVAELTKSFRLPKQSIVLWQGSETDGIQPFLTAYGKLYDDRRDKEKSCEFRTVIRSAHKQPTKCCMILNSFLRDTPDSVLITHIGLSNAAGPILSAHASIPVIAVPATFDQFTQDIWSSLRMPTNVPVMTVLDPHNAVLAALTILSQRNPALYAHLRLEQEKNFTNVCEI
jgi:phosphoribosylaminoimidazole carboxylase / phosphoribosylaminoimidazole-succinocarboxamide synthase